MQDQRRVNEAAEKFAEAIKESYQALADRSVSAQELNARLTREFFNGVITNLRTQAESNRALAEDLMEQQRKQQEASQALTQESVNAYTEFVSSMFAYTRRGTLAPESALSEGGPSDAAPDEGASSSAAEEAGREVARHPLNTWVRTSGRPRSRTARSRRRSSRR